jgi:succinate-acetate transporter protein
MMSRQSFWLVVTLLVIRIKAAVENGLRNGKACRTAEITGVVIDCAAVLVVEQLFGTVKAAIHVCHVIALLTICF